MNKVDNKAIIRRYIEEIENTGDVLLRAVSKRFLDF